MYISTWSKVKHVPKKGRKMGFAIGKFALPAEYLFEPMASNVYLYIDFFVFLIFC